MFFILYVIHYIMRIFAIVSFVNISVREQMEDLEVLNSRGCYLIRFVHLKKSLFCIVCRDQFRIKYYNLSEKLWGCLNPREVTNFESYMMLKSHTMTA